MSANMKNFIQPMLMAFTLLTRLPLTRFVSAEWSSKHYQLSVYYYPLVGAVIGLLVFGFSCLLPASAPPLLQAALILLVWVVLSGGLHLDGLADSFDAYFAAHKNPQKALAVFKDPASGPMGVTALILILLLKFAALASLQTPLLFAVLSACVAARAAALLMMNTTAYAREPDENGMVPQLEHPRVTMATYSVVIACMVLLFLSTPWPLAMFISGSVLLISWWWRRLWLKEINGFTGDCLGALIEMTETLVLLICALCLV